MKRLLMLWILFALTLSGAAQDTPDTEPSAFLRAMSLVPDVPLVRKGGPLASYGAYYEGIMARGGEVPESMAAMQESDSNRMLIALPPAGPTELRTRMAGFGVQYPDVVGFDFFQIAQGVEVGRITSVGSILIGDFDADAVIAAHEARGYTLEALDGGTLLCPAAGCETGRDTNVLESNLANPFGGQLGRSEPLYISDSVLLNSPDFEMLQALIAAHDGEIPSLADRPAFQAAANALSAYPAVPIVFAFDPASVQPSASLYRAAPDVSPLPDYELAAFASASDEDTEYALLVLVFAQGDVEASAASINQRLNAPAFADGTTYADFYGEVGTLEPAHAVTDDATGLGLVVIRLVAPKPPDIADDSELTPSNLPLRRLIAGLYQDGIPWLEITTDERTASLPRRGGEG